MIPFQPTPLKNIDPYPEYNSDNIFVFDDCFPEYLVADGEYQIGITQWEYGHYTDIENTSNDLFFGRQLFHALQGGMQAQFPPIVSNFVALLEQVLSKQIDPTATWNGIYRVSLNGQTPNQRAGIHVDTKECNTLWTAIYMSNTADGDLTFYKHDLDRTKTDSIEYKKGRIVIFPSGYPHEAQPPAATKWRTTVAVMFDLSTKKQYETTHISN